MREAYLPAMPLVILLPILLRVGAVAVFVVAVIVAGAANRSALMVPALAAAATLAGITRKKSGLTMPGMTVKEESLLARAGKMFLTRTLVFALLFGFTVVVAALFQETSLATETTLFDAALIAVPFILGFIFTEIASRTPVAGAAAMMGDLQTAFAEMQAGQSADEDGPIIDGEIIEPDDP